MSAPVEKHFRSPLIFTVTALLALTVLGINGQVVPLVVVLGILFLLPYFVPARLPKSVAIVWAVRLAVYVLAYQFSKTNDDGSGDFGDPRGVVILGCVAASEMVLQCWRDRPGGHPRGISLILFAGVAYLGACFTSDGLGEYIVKWLTPAFFMLLALSWRRLEAQTLHEPLSNYAKGVYIVTLVASVGIGFVIHALLSGNETNINAFAETIFNGRSPIEEPGMSDQPRLGTTFGLQGSSTRVLIIKGSLDDPHLRGCGFERYTNGTWGPSVSGRPSATAPSSLGVSAPRSRLLFVTKLRYASGLIYYPLESSYILLDGEPDTQMSVVGGGSLVSRTPTPSTYEFSQNDPREPVVDLSNHDSFDGNDLSGETGVDPRVEVLACAIVRNKRTIWEKIEAVCAELDSKHGYSLSYDPPPGDPVSGFILGNKPAHCEYFASAAVILLRYAGIPARYVTGYYAHEQDGNGNVVVRQRDAHAWAEAYDGHEWQTVDATPAGGRPDELYGKSSFWDELVDNIEDRLQLLQDQAQAIGPGKIVEGAAALIGLYFLVRVSIKELMLRRRNKKSNYATAGKLSSEAERFGKLLKKNDIAVSDGETWLEYFERTPQNALDQQTVLTFVEEYNASRFGSESNERLVKLLEELEQPVKTKEHA